MLLRQGLAMLSSWLQTKNLKIAEQLAGCMHIVAPILVIGQRLCVFLLQKQVSCDTIFIPYKLFIETVQFGGAY